MATQLVPYNTAMQLGSGFNSFTQTLCVDHAVIRDPVLQLEQAKLLEQKQQPEVAQSVIYKTAVITKTTDVTDEMSINGAFNIKYDQLSVNGSGQFINTSKIKDSDVSIMVSVKVVNQSIFDHSLLKFQPITHIKEFTPQRLIEVYGDSYISGWQEGGEFLAVISIKAKNRDEAQDINARAKIAFSQSKNTPAATEADKPGEKPTEKNGLSVNVNAQFDKIKNEIAAENEVSVSVTWSGGGQHLKAPEKDWTFDTMKEVALKFPKLVAETPMRTHAILTKYTALRSFYTTQTFTLPVYDKTGTYTNVLQEAYLDYKSILGIIQVLAYDVAEGLKGLITNPQAPKAVEQAKAISDAAAAAVAASEADADKPAKETPPTTDGESETGSLIEVSTTSKASAAKLVTLLPLAFNEPFAPTIAGLEDARLKCRFMMSRIVQEIDNIAIKPEIAIDETRQTPYLSPFLFKMLLPLGVTLAVQSNRAAQAAVAAKADPSDLAKRFTSVM